MLTMQVQYWNLQEAKRHNIVSERQTDFYNQETKRHNIAGEQETHRHNVVGEQLGWANLTETRRHNVASEGIGWATVSESQRHNQAMEGIANRQTSLEASRTFYQNKLDDARWGQTRAQAEQIRRTTELIPYQKWQIIGDTANKFTSAGRNLTSAVTDVWKTVESTRLVPYQKWQMIGDTANKFTGAGRNLTNAVSDIWKLLN